jgi:hypothetical protein
LFQRKAFPGIHLLKYPYAEGIIVNRLSRRIASLEASRPALRCTFEYDWDGVPSDLMERLAAAARGESELSDDDFFAMQQWRVRR